MQHIVTTKAVALTRYLPVSDPNAFSDVELPVSAPTGQDILVEVKAIAVNPVDTKVRAPKEKVEETPRVLGWDASVIVTAVGPDVTLFKPGDLAHATICPKIPDDGQGHGPRVFEMFLEPTCPFSARAFGKLDELLGEAGDDRITVKLRLLSQPWHMFSGVVTRCIIAASTLDQGKEAARTVMSAVAANRDEFGVPGPLQRTKPGHHTARYHRQARRNVRCRTGHRLCHPRS